MFHYTYEEKQIFNFVKFLRHFNGSLRVMLANFPYVRLLQTPFASLLFSLRQNASIFDLCGDACRCVWVETHSITLRDDSILNYSDVLSQNQLHDHLGCTQCIMGSTIKCEASGLKWVGSESCADMNVV